MFVFQSFRFLNLHFIRRQLAAWPLEAFMFETVLHEANAKTYVAEAEEGRGQDSRGWGCGQVFQPRGRDQALRVNISELWASFSMLLHQFNLFY